jgi:uncharacterized protein (DUF952 family)
MSSDSLVYKVMQLSDWNTACHAGVFNGSRDDVRDGFIHLSSYRQVAGTLRKHFHGQRDLVLIAYDASDLGPELKWETSRGGELFPHLYDSLPTSCARSVAHLTLDADGVPLLPGDAAP